MTAEECHRRAIARHQRRALARRDRDEASREADELEWNWIERELRRELSQVEDAFPAFVSVHTGMFQ